MLINDYHDFSVGSEPGVSVENIHRHKWVGTIGEKKVGEGQGRVRGLRGANYYG